MDVRSWGVLDFIKSSTQFVIPIYQRNYAWGEKQCGQLVEDIKRAGGHPSIQSHFTGSIVYIQQNNSASIGGSWLLIDGQQRLTTILLILEVIKRRLGDKSYAGLTKASIEQYYLIDKLASGNNKYKLLLSDTDRKTLIAILDGEESRLAPSEKSITVINNFNYFLKQITDENIETFCIGLAKLSVVGIALNREVDNPQLIFESMNSAGKSLSQADLIRNFVLMGLHSEDQEILYNSHWRPMEKEFGQIAYESDFDLFMRHYLTAKLHQLPKKGDVYDTFKFYMQSENLNAEAILSDVKRNAHYYAVMSYKDTPDEDYYIREEIKPIYRHILFGLKQTVAVPVMLTLHQDYENNVITGSDLRACLETLENYLFRRLVVGAPTNVLNNLLAMMPSKIDKDKYVDTFNHFFLSSDLYNRRFPTDQEFKEAFMSRSFYGTHFVRYAFDKLENHGFKEKTDISKYTIEHIMPQNPDISPEWQSELGPDYQRIWEEHLHRIGNLTLTGYNSEYSDKPFKEKLYLSAGSNQIGLFYSPLRINQVFRNKDMWTESEIANRGKNLADKALQIWAKPITSIPVDKTRKKKESYGASLLDLIDGGYLEAGMKLVSTSPTYPGEAILSPDGTIAFNGQEGLTPSGAGEACIHLINPAISRPNGWRHWGIETERGLCSLEEIRNDYLSN